MDIQNGDYRVWADTQIFKELAGGEVTDAELALLDKNAKDRYRWYRDEANGYIAFSFCDYDQKRDDTFGNNLVDALNKLGSDCWYLGNENEEYVFVN